MKRRHIENAALHQRYLRRYFGAVMLQCLDDDEVEAELARPADDSDIRPTDDRVINLKSGIAIFGAPASYGGHAVGYRISTNPADAEYVGEWF